MVAGSSSCGSWIVRRGILSGLDFNVLPFTVKDNDNDLFEFAVNIYHKFSPGRQRMA